MRALSRVRQEKVYENISMEVAAAVLSALGRSFPRRASLWCSEFLHTTHSQPDVGINVRLSCVRSLVLSDVGKNRKRHFYFFEWNEFTRSEYEVVCRWVHFWEIKSEVWLRHYIKLHVISAKRRFQKRKFFAQFFTWAIDFPSCAPHCVTHKRSEKREISKQFYRVDNLDSGIVCAHSKGRKIYYEILWECMYMAVIYAEG